MRDLLHPVLSFTTLCVLIGAAACSNDPKGDQSQGPRPDRSAGAQGDGSRDRDRDRDDDDKREEPANSGSSERNRLNPKDLENEENHVFKVPRDPSGRGDFRVQTYSQGLQDPAYQSAMIFYPEGITAGKKLPVTTLSGGYSNTKEQMTWMGEHLASHGMIVIAFTPTNNFSTNPTFWSRGHTGAFKKAQAEGARSASPIKGMVDPKRMGVMGFSMGGAGTILAVDELGGEAAGAIALCPYQPAVPKAKTPILYITGTNDTTARPGPVISAFERTQTGAPKGLENVQGMGHGDIIRSTTFRRQLARTITSWMGLYVGKNEQFKPLLENGNLKIQP